MKKNKILVVCQFFYPEKISSGILPYEMACELVKNDYEVTALVGYPKEYSDQNEILRKEVINGVNVKRVRYLTSSRDNFFGRIINYLSFCVSIILNFHSFFNIDYCISYTNPPLLPPIIALFSKLFKFKYIFEIYDLYPDAAIKSGSISGDGIIAKIFDKTTRYSLEQCWKIVVLSNECKNYLIKNKSVKECKVVMIPNWYSPQSVVRNSIIDTGELKILYGGNMGVMQDMDTIFSLVKELKNEENIKFIFAGHGVKKQKLKESVKKYNLTNCAIYDFLPKDEYDHLMNTVDLAIVSLEKFSLGLGSPSKVYGYLSKGIPLLAIMDENTDIVKDIKKYNCGIYVNNGQINILKNKLLEIYKDKVFLNLMSKNALKLFNEKYTLKKSMDKFIDLLN